MRRLFFGQVILVCCLFNFSLHAQIDSPQKHYAYAVDLMENGVYDAAKIEFVKIIHIYGENEYQDDACYYLGEIAFKENQLEVALHQWERLRTEYPKSSYIENVVQKINLASELLAKEEKARIEDLSIRALFDNAEFLLNGHCSVLSIDTSYLPSELMAKEWYRKIVEKYPDSQYAPKALFRQILIAYGWGEEGIGRYSEPQGYGLIYHRYYAGATEEAKMGIKASLEEMGLLLTELEEKYPDSYWLMPASFTVGQAHWITYKYTPDLSSKEEVKKYFQKVLELTEGNEFSLHRQIAKARLKELM